ncbi:unnamed protein product [Vicia faba]|uniref:Uncharacterized protein n=1 Tax=Vicia faba TaxID=3906 RepID=A0AAV1AGR2_VICFA|nr:unnamed protein product [Vicia faba]
MITDKEAVQTRAVEAESSQLRAGRVAPIDSHQKQMAEQKHGQFCTPRRRVTRVVAEEVPPPEEVHVVVVTDEEIHVPIAQEEVSVAEEVRVSVTDAEVPLIPLVD